MVVLVVVWVVLVWVLVLVDVVVPVPGSVTSPTAGAPVAVTWAENHSVLPGPGAMSQP